MTSPDQTTQKRLFRLVTKAFSSSFFYLAVDSVETPRAEAGEPAYTIKTAHWRRNYPNNTLHVGADPDAPDAVAVACAYLPGLSRSSKIGLGDIKNAPEAVQWETMTSRSLRFAEYNWALPQSSGVLQRLQWKRTKEHSVEGLTSGLSRTWILIEADEPDAVLAIFRLRGRINHCATVQMNVDRGKELDYMVLVTGMLL